MKLLAPITAIIAAASAGQIYSAGQSAENYANSAELYQSGLEHQQRGLYSDQSQKTQAYVGHEVAYHSRPEAERIAKILNYDIENNGHQYKYSYETENGIKAEELGKTSEHGTQAHGAYSYTGDDGKVYTVTYTADENGFHPQGEHLPTPPPIPEEILRSMEQNAKDEAAGIYDDGKYKEQSTHSMSHGGDHGYQQHEAYQTLSYQAPSGHAAGAELAYYMPSHHASSAEQAYHAPSHHASSAELAYHAPSHHSSGAELAYHGSSGHSSGAELAYHAHSGHSSGAELAYHAPSGHSSGAYHAPTSHVSNVQLAYHAPSGHASGAELAYHAHARH